MSEQAVNTALDWLAHSHIRHFNGTPQIAHGGVNQGYHWKEQRYPFVYTEITGYAVSAFVIAHRWTGEERYLTMARDAAAYIKRVQDLVPTEQAGAVLHGLTIPGYTERHQYFSFDTAMCLQGLLDLLFVSPSAEMEQSARAMGDWLIDRMQLDSGAFIAMIDGDTGASEHLELFGDRGCLHGKHAIGLLKLGQYTGDERYITAGKKVADWVITLQQPAGAFRATEYEPQTLSHTHSYATEGLLYAHFATQEQRYFDAALKAGQWLLNSQNRDGSLNIAYNRNWLKEGRRIVEAVAPKKVTDATSQSLRIWLLLHYLTHDPKFFTAAERAQEHLLRMQCTESADQNAIGGFYFWPGHPIMFTWATQFATHALYAFGHHDRENGYERLITELY